jgi:prepilin-type N-terminal cleavage/methylation domain-containing protein
MNRRRNSGGFTLMEVLAAIVLIAIVLPVAMHGISIATAVGGAAKFKAEAAILAQSKLTELVVTKAWQNEQLSGDFGEDHPNYRWAAAVNNWDGTLQQLDLEIIWETRGREQSVIVSTLVETEAN